MWRFPRRETGIAFHPRPGSLLPAKQGQPGGSKLDVHELEILAMIENRKDIALHEIAEQLEHKHGVKAATSTVFQFLARRGITFKKRQPMPVNTKDPMCLSAG